MARKNPPKRASAAAMRTPYRVHLKNVHPGVGMPHLGGFYAPLHDKKVRINSYAGAQQAVTNFIDRYELGTAAWAGGDIFDKSGNYLGYVSYNGRLWKGKKRTNPMQKHKGSAVSPQEVAQALHQSPSEKLIRMGGLTAHWGTDGDYQLSAGTSSTGEPLGFYLGVTVLETSHPLTFPKQVLLALAKKMQVRVIRGTVDIDPQSGEAGAIVKPQKTKKNPYRRTPINKSKAIPKGKRVGERFSRDGKTFVVISYVTHTGKRVRYARAV